MEKTTKQKIYSEFKRQELIRSFAKAGVVMSYGQSVALKSILDSLHEGNKAMMEFNKSFIIETCPNCNQSIMITYEEIGHSPDCDVRKGRRGWRQLGIYDS